MRSITATLACVAIFAPCLSAQGSFVITWREARVSVHADSAPLTELLREVARQTGVQIVGSERVEGTYSGDFVDRPLVEGLELLLEDVNYLMAVREPSDATTRPTIRIWLHSRRSAGDALPTPLASPEASSEGNQDSPESAQVEDPPPSQAVDAEDGGGHDEPESADPDEAHVQQLERAGFFDDATPSLLIDTARSKNAVLRAKALRVLTERDPSMAADVLAAAVSDTDATVSSAAAELLGQVDGLEVRERLGSLLQNPDPVIRFTALELLRRRPDPDILSYVQRALHDENAAIRATAQSLIKELEVKAPERKDDLPKMFQPD
ncbi:MAG TPA: HEAT repeat domain-containing protein [Vicinamibacterales bacterium]|nr:HEAT repeat domain-containing protein [Vicinamibacterales bacterium]HEX2460640.1 HEAT repeat domain-containing protein [Vicinamibacterales bacterium]